MKSIRVVVAEDDAEFRAAVVDLISAEQGLEVVGAAGDAEEVVEVIREHHPDVALVDVRMPGAGGVEAARQARRISSRTRIVAVTAYEDQGTVLEMLWAGAVGYVVKGGAPEEIVAAVRNAASGRSAISHQLSAEVIEELSARLETQAQEEQVIRQQEQRIRSVLDRPDALDVVFQPLVDLGTGRVLGLEALARFDAEPRRPPNEWFDDAAAAGLQTELELTAVRIALSYMTQLHPEMFLSLNVSPSTLITAAFGEFLSAASSQRIVLEVTEHAPVGDYEVLATTLKGFRGSRGRLAVDDAGAGFASLRHIVRLEPDIIKLDISLTRGIHRDRTLRALAAALISFARETDVVIVAEGIEDRRELEALVGLGVPWGQGYHLARPGPLPAPRSVEVYGNFRPRRRHEPVPTPGGP